MPDHGVYRNPFFRLVGAVIRRIPVKKKYCMEGVLMRNDVECFDLPVTEIKNCMCGWADQNDIEFMRGHPETARKRDVFDRRSDVGQRCFCAKRDGRVLGFNWVSFQSGSVLFGKDGEQTFFVLPRQSVFTDDLYTYSDARRQGIAALMKSHQFASLRSMGMSVAYNLILLGNAASLALFLKLGAVPETLVHCYRLGSFQKAFFGTRGEARRLQCWAQRLQAPQGG